MSHSPGRGMMPKFSAANPVPDDPAPLPELLASISVSCYLSTIKYLYVHTEFSLKGSHSVFSQEFWSSPCPSLLGDLITAHSPCHCKHQDKAWILSFFLPGPKVCPTTCALTLRLLQALSAHAEKSQLGNLSRFVLCSRICVAGMCPTEGVAPSTTARGHSPTLSL